MQFFTTLLGHFPVSMPYSEPMRSSDGMGGLVPIPEHHRPELDRIEREYSIDQLILFQHVYGSLINEPSGMCSVATMIVHRLSFGWTVEEEEMMKRVTKTEMQEVYVDIGRLFPNVETEFLCTQCNGYREISMWIGHNYYAKNDE